MLYGCRADGDVSDSSSYLLDLGSYDVILRLLAYDSVLTPPLAASTPPSLPPQHQLSPSVDSQSSVIGHRTVENWIKASSYVDGFVLKGKKKTDELRWLLPTPIPQKGDDSCKPKTRSLHSKEKGAVDGRQSLLLGTVVVDAAKQQNHPNHHPRQQKKKNC